MATESATYIDGLDSSKPAGTESPAEGDDHLRLIKSTIKATFPNLTGAVTAVQGDLNLLTGVAAAVAGGTILSSKAVIYGSSGEVSANAFKVGTTAITTSVTLGAITTTDTCTFSGTALRLKGDFTNATVNSRLWVQSSTTNGNTSFGVIPNGSATQAQVLVSNNSTPTESAYMAIGINNSTAYLYSSRLGSSTSGLPLAIGTGDSVTARMTISAAGDVEITGDQIGIATTQTPANASATGVKGTICWDENYIYVCTATDTWKRASIATWT